uniref:Uncharacterized protein n=1 Tax=Oryza meridionalis TaxID=40149 RepID=A0A0E0EQ33_9ORYZ
MGAGAGGIFDPQRCPSRCPDGARPWSPHPTGCCGAPLTRGSPAGTGAGEVFHLVGNAGAGAGEKSKERGQGHSCPTRPHPASPHCHPRGGCRREDAVDKDEDEGER